MTTLSIIFLIIIIYLIIGWFIAIIFADLMDREDLLICFFWIITIPFIIIKEKILKK